MRLRHRVLLIIGVITAIAMVVVYQAVAYLLVNSYQQMENDDTLSQAKLVRNNLDYDLDKLASITRDRARGDDSNA